MHYIIEDAFEDHYYMRNIAGDVRMTIQSELARRLKPRVADASCVLQTKYARFGGKRRVGE
jgi:hypothetical protein